MFKLDETIFDETSLGELSPTEKSRMLQYVYETLELRVGLELASRANSVQLAEFDKLSNKNNSSSTMDWLEANFPDFEQVVADELIELKSELKAMAAEVLRA